MNLQTWRTKKGLTQVALAQRLGVTQGLLSKWERGLVIPGGRWMARIIEVTAGAVQTKDLVGEPGRKGRA